MANRDAQVSDIRDLWVRLIVSPVLGAAVVSLSGLITHSRHSTSGLVGSYAYFSLVAFLIWTGNRWLYARMPRREDWLQRPSRRLAALLAVIALVSVPIATLLIGAWRWVTGDPGSRAFALPVALLAIIFVVVLITHVYETVFVLRDWESDRLRTTRLEQTRLEAELEALGREVDPHFLFNHLNVLAHLIEERQPGAATFVTTLAATYRYVLDARGRRLVPLSEELAALRRHETLAAIRFGSGINVQVDVDTSAAMRLHLPPVTLTELFQNAIKHNAVGPEQPLVVRLSVDGGSLIFENDLRTRSEQPASTGIGLENLARRVALATGREVTWGVEGARFVVRVPIV